MGMRQMLRYCLQHGFSKNIPKVIGVVTATVWSPFLWAEEGYRYLHVTIDTPWAIFLFLLCIVLFPFVLMAVLYWYFAFKKKQELVDAKVQAEATSDQSAP